MTDQTPGLQDDEQRQADFDTRLRGGLASMARDAERRSNAGTRSTSRRRGWTGPLMAAAAVVAVVATGAVAATQIGGGDGQDPATPAATASATEATNSDPTSAPATPTVSKDQVNSTAEKVTAFENLPGFAQASVDYESGQVEVLWKGAVPAGLEALAGERPNGVVVVIKPADYSAADLDAAGRSLFSASPEERDGAEVVTTAGNGDYSGLVVEIVKPWSGSTDKLEAIAGVPVEVVFVDGGPEVGGPEVAVPGR
ncbi:MAG TPA: hypothetical protein VM575_09500 [Nocardioides sp.]|jgi:hypothetical protein|nr:hypothetical protein [Nocardioides sp.]